jgi:hypothetical protein
MMTVSNKAEKKRIFNICARVKKKGQTSKATGRKIRGENAKCGSFSSSASLSLSLSLSVLDFRKSHARRNKKK